MTDIRVTVSGPFFRLGARPFLDAVHNAVRALTEEGEAKVKDQLYPGHGLITGHYRRSVVGELTDSLHGRIHDSNVVYGPWLEGVSRRNETTRFKGYHMFRRAGEQLQRTARETLQRFVRAAVGRVT